MWRQKIKLKNTTFGISEDYSAEIRKQRSTLWKWGETMRKKGKKTFLHFDRLQVEDKEYKVDKVTNEVYESTRLKKSTNRVDNIVDDE